MPNAKLEASKADAHRLIDDLLNYINLVKAGSETNDDIINHTSVSRAAEAIFYQLRDDFSEETKRYQAQIAGLSGEQADTRRAQFEMENHGANGTTELIDKFKAVRDEAFDIHARCVLARYRSRKAQNQSHTAGQGKQLQGTENSQSKSTDQDITQRADRSLPQLEASHVVEDKLPIRPKNHCLNQTTTLSTVPASDSLASLETPSKGDKVGQIITDPASFLPCPRPTLHTSYGASPMMPVKQVPPEPPSGIQQPALPAPESKPDPAVFGQKNSGTTNPRSHRPREGSLRKCRSGRQPQDSACLRKASKAVVCSLRPRRALQGHLSRLRNSATRRVAACNRRALHPVSRRRTAKATHRAPGCHLGKMQRHHILKQAPHGPHRTEFRIGPAKLPTGTVGKKMDFRFLPPPRSADRSVSSSRRPLDRLLSSIRSSPIIEALSYAAGSVASYRPRALSCCASHLPRWPPREPSAPISWKCRPAVPSPSI